MYSVYHRKNVAAKLLPHSLATKKIPQAVTNYFIMSLSNQNKQYDQKRAVESLLTSCGGKQKIFNSKMISRWNPFRLLAKTNQVWFKDKKCCLFLKNQ